MERYGMYDAREQTAKLRIITYLQILYEQSEIGCSYFFATYIFYCRFFGNIRFLLRKIDKKIGIGKN